MTIAKEYIDRIDKLNLFYLSFMLKGIFQWCRVSLVTYVNADRSMMYDWIFPIQFQVFSVCNTTAVVTTAVYPYIDFRYYDNYHAYIMSQRPGGGSGALQNRCVAIGY